MSNWDNPEWLEHQVILARRALQRVLRVYGPNSYRLAEKRDELKLVEQRLAEHRAPSLHE